MSTASSHQTKKTGKQVIALIKDYQNNTENEATQTKLVEHYKGLVLSLARKFAKNKELEDDLYQVGMIGLLAALERFDTDYGKSFESFAVPTIVGEIKRYIRDKTWSVHVPRRVKELGPKVKRAVENLTGELQRSPSVKDIADYLEVSEEDILETMELGRSYQAASVDNDMEADEDGGTVSLLDLLGQQEQGYRKIDEKLMLNKAFEVLSEREREIVYYTYYLNMSQKETGDKVGISQMHVSRLQRRALRKLRESLSHEGMTS